jgi:hypothetical protein
MPDITQIGFGTLAVIIILDRIGIIDRFLPKKNGVIGKLDELKDNHLHEVTEKLDEIIKTLERMERNQTEGREKIVEKLSYISARINGG